MGFNVFIFIVITILANGNSTPYKEQAPEPIVLSMRNALRNPSQRWPGGIVPYVLNGDFTQSELNAIGDGMDEITRSSCVRFVLPRSPDDNRFVSIQKMNSGGCHATIGMPGARHLPAHVYLQDTCFTSRTITHELLHVLGFVHMQQNYNRDDHVNVYFENIRQRSWRDFARKNQSVVTDFGYPYDYESIMHYSGKSKSKNGEVTMTAKRNPLRVLGGPVMTETDINKLNSMYCNIRKKTSSPTVERSHEPMVYRRESEIPESSLNINESTI